MMLARYSLAVLLVLSIAAVGLGCGGAEPKKERVAAPEKKDPIGKKVAGESDQVSASDYEVTGRLNGHIRQFNNAFLPLMVAYRDPDVSTENWLAQAKPALRRFRSANLKLNGDMAELQDADLRRYEGPFVQALKDEADGVEDLRFVIASGGTSREVKSAARAIDRAAEKANRHSDRFLELARPYLDRETLRALIKARDKRFEKLLGRLSGSSWNFDGDPWVNDLRRR